MSASTSAMNSILQGLASSELERTKSYLERGRRFADLDEASLERAFTESMEEWARDPSKPATYNDDVTSEYSLRKLSPPLEKTSDSLAAIGRTMQQSYDAMTEEAREKANEALAAKFLAQQSVKQ